MEQELNFDNFPYLFAYPDRDLWLHFDEILANAKDVTDDCFNNSEGVVVG